MKPVVKKGEIKRVKKVEPSEADVQEVNEKESLLDKVEAELARDGINMFGNDSVDRAYLVLPPHLDEEDAREVGRYLHTFTQQRIWTRTLLSRIGVLLREAHEELDRDKARIYADLPPRMSVTEKELALYQDEKASVILERVKNISAKCDMLDSYMENLADGIFSISREISRRGMDYDSQNRVENVNSKRR